jgi:hypothetical protein
MSTPKLLITAIACAASPVEAAVRDFEDRVSPAFRDDDAVVEAVVDAVVDDAGAVDGEALPVELDDLASLPHASRMASHAGLASAAVRNVRRSMSF